MSRIKTEWERWIRLRAQQFVGGDIALYDNSDQEDIVHRGPIRTIILEGDVLVITTEWSAYALTDSRGLPTGPWSKWPGPNPNPNRFAFPLTAVNGQLWTGRPLNNPDGTTTFRFPFRVTLFPRGGPKLDRSKVRGL